MPISTLFPLQLSLFQLFRNNRIILVEIMTTKTDFFQQLNNHVKKNPLRLTSHYILAGMYWTVSHS